MYIPGSGSKKLYRCMPEKVKQLYMQGIGRDKFHEILREANMLQKKKPLYKGPGTDSRKSQYIEENKKRGKQVSRILEYIESDMTAIKVGSIYMALSLTMDVYSRMILGAHLCSDWGSEEASKALQEAGEYGLSGSIHHSDRGSVYACEHYRKLCERLGIEQSMSRSGKPTDAAHIERLNRTLKSEYKLGRRFANKEEAIEAIRFAIASYNELRPHLSLGMRTPSEVYRAGLEEQKQSNSLRATPSRS